MRGVIHSEENEGKKSPILWFRGTPGTPNNIIKQYLCGPSVVTCVYGGAALKQ